MKSNSPPNASDFVAALQRYVGQLEYRPRKSCIVTETASGPRGFCDCAGLPLMALRDIGVLPSDFDPNFPGALNREREILRILKRLGRCLPSKTPFKVGDVLVTGKPRAFHVMIIGDMTCHVPTIIEAPRAHGLVCERRFDAHEAKEMRSAFRLF